MRLLLLSVFALVACAVAAPEGTSRKATPLPALDGKSGKGLKIECRLVKNRFAVGEPINMWCTVTNTTDSTKPVGWHPNTGVHFRCVREGKATRGGVLPRAFPQFRVPTMVKSQDMRPGYILYVPPKASVQILLSHRAERPKKFRGTIIYDPVGLRGIWGGKLEDGPPWKGEWVRSNVFEYEVVEATKE